MLLDLDNILKQFIYNPNEPLIFSSGLFVFLFAAFLCGFWLLHKKHKLKIIYTILFSLFFYYKSSGIYFLILIGSTVVDYTLAYMIWKTQDPYKRRAWLVFSLVINLGMLGYFKYTNFLFEIFADLSASNFEPLHIILPVGVSFFTFQSLSYTIDIYRKEIEPVKDIWDYAFFVSFFPQLVAGPIVRAKDFLPQVAKDPIVTLEMLGRGVFLICIGLFKKAVISDYISVNFVDRIFDNPILYSGFECLMGVYGYALQIYCDFSGYSDMAIGVALLFGYELCKNFDSPYQSLNITEFWRRWHISLSTWLRDYLYISLGGNRKGKWRTYFNLMLTMLLGGLWHGAGFKFILWGGLHGAALAGHKFYLEQKTTWSKIHIFFNTRGGKLLAWFLTFHFVCFCWVYFRASDMNNAADVLGQIAFAFDISVLPQFVEGYPYIILLLALGYALHLTPTRWEHRVREEITYAPLLAKGFAILVMIILVIQVKSAEVLPFIYFQF